jgi:site-specific DNA-methyltransferase (adenine-specific)
VSIQPYYQDEAVTLYHGDCLDVLPTLSGIDLVVTSPPYNKGKQSGAYANMREGYEGYGDDLPDEAYVEWQRAVMSALWESLSDNGAIFYNHKQQVRDGVALLPTRLAPDHVLLRQIIIWNRKGGMNWSPTFFVPQHEWVLLYAKPAFKLKSRGASAPGDVWNLGIDSTDNDHPCAFPIGLPNIAIDATDAKVILDPFAGSGTTLRSAMDLGRKAIGIEKSERYCEVIAKRLAQGVLL